MNWSAIAMSLNNMFGGQGGQLYYPESYHNSIDKFHQMLKGQLSDTYKPENSKNELDSNEKLLLLIED